MAIPTNLTIRQQSKVLEIAFDDGAAFSIPFEHMDDAALFREEQAARTVGNGRQRHGRAHFLGNQFQADIRNVVRLCNCRRTRNSERQKQDADVKQSLHWR